MIKNNILKSLLAIATVFVMTGCGGSSSPVDDVPITLESPITGSAEELLTTLPIEIQDAIDGPVSKLSEELTNALSYMGNEERLAYDVYNALSVQYPNSGPLNKIPDSEYVHITAVQQLIQKYKLSDDIHFTNIDLPALGYMNTAIEDMEAGTYDIAKIQKLYDDLVLQGSVSEIEALKVGCIIEVVDVHDLDEYIKLAQKSNATDIETVFTSLRAGSYNHYWSFDKVLKNKDVINGCCSVGEDYCKTEKEYPSHNG
ncbi:MAG: hypothetical protein DRG09_04625 [Epsilonproteobacteria bacterium]|nr:MAG: hypothetical protein DRG09_04625 [Campylobacterota bacterium]